MLFVIVHRPPWLRNYLHQFTRLILHIKVAVVTHALIFVEDVLGYAFLLVMAHDVSFCEMYFVQFNLTL